MITKVIKRFSMSSNVSWATYYTDRTTTTNAIKRLLLAPPLPIPEFNILIHTQIFTPKLFSCKSRMQEGMEMMNKPKSLVCVCERTVGDLFPLFILSKSKLLFNEFDGRSENELAARSMCIHLPGEPLNLKRSATNANQTVPMMLI